jgi:hypothetical protein
LVTLAATVGVTVNAAFVGIVTDDGVVKPFITVINHCLFKFRTEEEITLAHVLPVRRGFGGGTFTNASGRALSTTFAGRVSFNATRFGITGPRLDIQVMALIRRW